MNSIIRKAVIGDLPLVMSLISSGRSIMRSVGNPLQWPEGYPSEDTLRRDIEQGFCHLLVRGGRAVATFSFIPGPDPTYYNIYEGAWPSDEPYHVVHRIASLPDAHGCFREIMGWCFTQSPCIRVDTHRDNLPMRHSLLAYGFRYCGIIHLMNGDERLAYQMRK